MIANMKIKVITFGKSSDSYSDDIERFVKMSRPWATVEFLNLKSSETHKDSLETVLAREAKLIRKHLPVGAKVVTLGEEGRLMNSADFAQVLSKTAVENREIVFVIGSAFGVSNEIKKESDMILSLSPLTFPYKLCKLVFAEQVYRALSICNNHPYHKE